MARSMISSKSSAAVFSRPRWPATISSHAALSSAAWDWLATSKVTWMRLCWVMGHILARSRHAHAFRLAHRQIETLGSFNIKFKRECQRRDGLPHFSGRQMGDAIADLGFGYGLEIVKIRGTRIRQTVGLRQYDLGGYATDR